MSDLPHRHLRFVKAEWAPVSPHGCAARVQLEQAGTGRFVGTAVVHGTCGEAGALRAAAKAAAAAVMQAVGQDHILEVYGVEPFQAFGRAAVLVHLGARLGQRTQELVGLCVSGEDSARAAALAVLDAANRVLGLG